MLPYEYDGLGDVLRKTLKYEGFRGLYKGLTPNLLKVTLMICSTNVRSPHRRQLHILFIPMFAKRLG